MGRIECVFQPREMTMAIPVLTGAIDRRILVNYRVDPAVLAAQLPAPFRPRLVRGYGLAGVCLTRLRGVRPRLLPGWLGVASENAAHRAAVEWDERGELRRGVFFWRRDTDSWLNAMAGGLWLSGIHRRARFRVRETDDHFEVAWRSTNGQTRFSLVADLALAMAGSTVFASLDEAAAFFKNAARGHSTTAPCGRVEGLELDCRQLPVSPLAIAAVQSSFFDDASRFPKGSITLDSGFLMRCIQHEPHAQPELERSAETLPAPILAGAAAIGA